MAEERETAAGAKAAADKAAAAAKVAQQAAADQAAAAAKTAAGANSAPPVVEQIPAPVLGEMVDAPPCEQCEQNAARIEQVEMRVAAIGKLVLTALVAGAALYLLRGLESGRRQPAAAVEAAPEPAE